MYSTPIFHIALILKILRLYIIKTAVLKAISSNIPKVRLRAYQYTKWFSPELRHKLKCLHTLQKKYKHSPTSHNLDGLNHAEAQFQLNIDSTKFNYDANLIHGFANHNNSKIYRVLQRPKIFPMYFILTHPLLQLMLIKLCFTTNILVLWTQIVRLLYQICAPSLLMLNLYNHLIYLNSMFTMPLLLWIPIKLWKLMASVLRFLNTVLNH